MTKISPKKVKDESEFILIAKAINEYSEDLKRFTKMHVSKQNELLISFGKDANTLTLILFEWIHRNDKNE